ncbi:MAG: phosphoglycerate kinase [Phycisphaerae bacterium]
MPKLSIDDINVQGLRVLVRLDLNVPLDDHGRITDDRRIQAALPTVQKLLHDGGRLILISHLGRPKGDPEKDKRLTLEPIAERLAHLLGQPVMFVPDCVGPEVQEKVKTLRDGQCCVLENLRFHEGETIKDAKAKGDPDLRSCKDQFAEKLAALADVYVNDAFGTCHRDNASMLTVPQKMHHQPRVMGYLVAKELKFLGGAVADPKRPFVVILGGAKVSDKVGTIEALLEKCDTILIGGAMAFTFAAAQGTAVGRSLTEPDRYDTARRLQAKAGDRIRLPIDSVAAAEIRSDAPTRVCESSIPQDMMGLDVGPKTISAYRDILQTAGTIVWNGPMGVFETPPFDTGTLAIANAVANATDRGAVTIVGGGDSAAAISAAGLSDRITHVSTGGGASLEFLEGKPFAAIEILDEA